MQVSLSTPCQQPILPECCSHFARREEQLTALQSTAISERLHLFCISISFCRSMQQHVVYSWAQAASLGCQAMLCSTLQLWSLASRFRKNWHFGTAQGHTQTHTKQTQQCQAFCKTSADCCSNSRSSICCNWPVSYCGIIHPMVSFAAVNNSCNKIAMISKNIQVTPSWLYVHLARLVCKTSGFGNHKLLHIMCRADSFFS